VPRVRKEFDSRREAELFQREYLLRFSITPASTVVADTRRLMELIGIWYRYHGINLADAERRKRALEAKGSSPPASTTYIIDFTR
jgi:hypothetical protein